jgi:hypothetical protein
MNTIERIKTYGLGLFASEMPFNIAHYICNFYSYLLKGTHLGPFINQKEVHHGALLLYSILKLQD